MACLHRFPGVTHVQFLVHSQQKRLIIRPCKSDTPDSLRWAIGGEEKEIKNREMVCKIFAAKVFDLMGWKPQYRYKILGKPAVYGNEALYLFKLTDFELFDVNPTSKKTKTFYPEDWRNCFGTPVESHEQEYKIDLADGYISTGKI